METIRSIDVGKDLIKTISDDREIILDKLPKKMNARYRSEKWFNLFSRELKEASESERNGNVVEVWSNPIGKAFDISGGWTDGGLKSYVARRKAEGYYRRYMAARRSGQIVSKGLFSKANEDKRVPFLARVVYKVPALIGQILKEEGKL